MSNAPAEGTTAPSTGTSGRGGARRLLRVLGFGLTGLALVLLAGGIWLLRTDAGRDFALARALALLPSDSLSWRHAEGGLSGPVVLHGLRYADRGLVIEIERAELDLAPLALAGRTLHVEALRLENGRVQLPPGQARAPTWDPRRALPARLPELRLPLALAIDALSVRNVGIAQDGLPVLQVHALDAAGRLERGRLALQRLELDSDRLRVRAHGALDTAADWDTGLRARIELAGLGTEALPVQLEARGNARDFTVQAHAALPGTATLALRVSGGLPDPQWQLQVDAAQVEPQRVGRDGEPLALALRAAGDLGQARLEAELRQGARWLRIEPSTLRLDQGVLQFEPLVLVVPEGRLQARGSVDLRRPDGEVALELSATELSWSAPESAARVVAEARARIEGPRSHLVTTLQGELRRGAERASVTLRGQGDVDGMRIDALTLASERGRLEASGHVAWSPQLEWTLQADLQGFDPSWLAKDFPGAVDATLASRGALAKDAVSASVRIESLGGQLRGRRLGGQGQLEFHPDSSGEGTLGLRLGDSRLQAHGRWGDTLALQADLEAVQLADAWPAARGRIAGRVALRGSRAAPELEVSLDGQDLALGGYAAQSASLRAKVPPSAPGQIVLRAERARIAGHAYEALTLQADGTRAVHRVQLALRGGPAEVAMALEGGEREGRWRGRLQALRVLPREQRAWTLQDPADLAFDPAQGELRLGRACLSERVASLCVQADWNDRAATAQLTLDALPLSILDPFLAGPLEAPAAAHGSLSGRIHASRDATGALRGEAWFTSREGGLRLDPEAPRDWLVYRDLDLRATFDSARASLTLQSGLGREGRLSASLSTDQPLQDDGRLSGEVEADLRDLTFLELFGQALVAPRGHLGATLAVSGTRAAPQLRGRIDLRDFAAEVPAVGLALSEGRLALQSEGDGRAAIEASVRSGAGRLVATGRYDAAAEDRVQLALQGEDVTAADLPEVNAVVSPDLRLQWRGDVLRLRGDVAVTRARIELERLQSVTAPSPDAVIVDAGAAESAPGLSLDSDIDLVLGEDVRLAGFGLKGRLEGRLGLRDRPGRATVARGGVQVSGEYKAYGQDLTITRGRLGYASTPLDNPALDIRAEREVDRVTVGVQVRGTALAPELTLWSEPALDQAEQLSYLVLGRPLRSASQADGAALSQAAAAFGGNLLAQKLGARLGLDEVGVADSRALGGAALTVGKFLSPRLYVSYGVSLFGAGQVVTFKYLLSRVWSVQIDSGRENRAALNYRLER